MKKNPPTHERSVRSKAAKGAQTRLARGAKDLQDGIVKATRSRPGQPTKFTPEIWAEILDRIACYENIMDICADDHMPSVMTVRSWYRTDPMLKSDMEEAWLDASYLGHAVNDNILRGGVMSTGDFRRDEALVANNRWFMGKTSKRMFGDKQTVDLSSTIHIAVPSWANALPTPSMEVVQEGEALDPDAVFETQTVERLGIAVASKTTTDAQDDTLEADPHT